MGGDGIQLVPDAAPYRVNSRIELGPKTGKLAYITNERLSTIYSKTPIPMHHEMHLEVSLHLCRGQGQQRQESSPNPGELLDNFDA